MASFPTTGPIRLIVDLSVGDVTIAASERRDATVDVRPRSTARAGDARAAEGTTIDFRADMLVVRAPKARLSSLLGFGRGDAVDVTVALPVGSHVEVETMMGTVRINGRIGDGRVRTGDGPVRLDEAASLIVDTGRGDVTARDIAGRAEVSTGMGSIRIGGIAGSATIKNSHGGIEVGSVGADLRLSASHGEIVLGRSEGEVVAKTAYGSIRADEVALGSVQLETAYGQIEVGIRAGTSAFVDAHTAYGRVRNMLSADDAAPPTGATAEVRARTAYGDITIRRIAGRAPKGQSR
ncbi:MAG: DUF4097 family beta strand repeat protein [Bauldia sp.]|nr:DUF4097 family beta strand repeat protein [Bauldia sp.]MCW5716864.1 DUF4097 family beta strand repeat protein [Bauldia sp.]